MRQSIHVLRNTDSLQDFLDSDEIRNSAKDASAIVVQVYSMASDPALAAEVAGVIETVFPGAVVVGASTVGEVAFGETHTVSTLLVFNFFQRAQVSAVAQACPTGAEYTTGYRVGESLRCSINHMAGVLLLATPLSFDASLLLKGLGETLGDCPVFGGGAGDYAAMVKSWVLQGQRVFDQGVVAVALAGEGLQIVAQTSLGWQPFGREMTVTETDGMKIVSIDDKPALEVYQRYIHVADLEDFGVIASEFPFLFNTNDGTVARVPIAADASGSLFFMANVQVGERFRIGYGDPLKMLNATTDMHRSMRDFEPEGILVFSCGCRRYLMQEDVKFETAPFEAIAPTAGFYTYGEFFGSGNTLRLLNAALLAVGIRESAPATPHPSRRVESDKNAPAGQHDPYAQQHSRVLSSLAHFIGSVTDELAQANTDLKNLTDELRQTQELYHLVADNSTDVIWLLDLPDLRFRYMSPSVQRRRGWTAQELMAMPLSAILGSEMETRVRTALVESFGKLKSGDDSARFITMELELPHKDGHLIPMEVAATILLDCERQPYQVLGISRDIAERKAAEEAIRRMAFYDHLTGLPNRRLLEDRLHQSLVKAHRNHHQLALLFIDLDKFKAVNDGMGHEAGDWLLRQVAERLQQCLRESDTVARIGGDEFIVLLPDIGAVQDAIEVAEKIRAALENPFTMDDGETIHISSSIGAVIYPDHATEARDLLRMGDEAMYLAKKGGRNAVELYAPVPPVHTEGVPVQFIIWKPAFASGDKAIDDEHQELFRRANALIDLAFRNHPDPMAFNQAFDEFLSLVKDHFDHEEEILRALGYADLAQHAKLHHALLENAYVLRDDIDSSGVPRVHMPTGRIVEFLVNEVAVGHLIDADRGYFQLLLKPAASPG